MTDETTASVLVEEWKRKCYEFSDQSDDALIPSISKVFDACDVILNGCDQSRIQLALKLLEHKLSSCLIEEATGEPSIRTVMCGLIQSVHAMFMHMTSSNDSTSTDILLEMIKEWKTNSFEFSNKSTDVLIPVILEVFEAFAVVLKNPHQFRVHLALESVEYVRSNCLSAENTDEPSIRTLIYGVIHCVQRCLLDMTALNNSITSEELDKDEITDPDDMYDKKIKKEEPMDDGTEDEVKDIDLPMLAAPSKSRLLQKRKSTVDGSEKAKRLKAATNGRRSRVKINDTELECPECNYRTRSAPAWVKHLRTHSTTPSQAGLILRCACGHESAASRHSAICNISKITIVRKEDGTAKEAKRNNDTELECPDDKCEYRTLSATSMREHLKKKHNTTLKKAGYMLRCECGDESFSDLHARYCDISKITVVRKEVDATKMSGKEMKKDD